MIIETNDQASELEYFQFLKRTAVVIQGPLISKGRTPKSRDIPVESVTERDIVTFDCTDNVARIIKTWGRNFGAILCVTWQSEEATELIDLVGREHVLQISDTTPTIMERNNVIPGNNKFRQFLSLSAGLDALKSTDLQFALKIRTDQTPDIMAMARILFDAERAGLLKYKIFVPAYKVGMGFGIEDFYFGGRFQILSELCRIYLGYGMREFSFHVHCDLFGKLSFGFFAKDVSSPLYGFFLRGSWEPITAHQKAIAQYAWCHLFHTFPRHLWENTAWRGIPLGSYAGNKHSDDEDNWFYKQVDDRATNKKRSRWTETFLNFVYTDWERLFVFVLGTHGRLIGKALNNIAGRTKAFADGYHSMKRNMLPVNAGKRF